MLEINNKTKFKINSKELGGITEKFLSQYRKKNKEISLALLGEKKMKELNNIYRGKNYVTDILSFAGEDGFLGELIICPKQIERQARLLKHSFKKEFVFIFVHGLLHLVGYTDETEKKKLDMIKRGEEFIYKISKL